MSEKRASFGLIAAGSAFGSAITCGVMLALFLPMQQAPLAIADGENASPSAGNLQVSVPTRIDYVAREDGTLMTASPSSFAIVNEGEREARVEAVQVSSASGWTAVEDASASNTQNAVSIKMGVAGEQVDAFASEEQKTDVGQTVTSQASWTLAAAGTSPSSASRIELSTDGEVANVSPDNISGPVGTTAWYVVDSTVTNDVYDRLEILEEKADATPLNAYPVGAVYISTTLVDPSEVLGGGTWERITGQFLLSATDGGNSGASQAAGNTGGEATHVLTPSETATKNHTHSYDKANSTTGGHSLTLAQIPSHTHSMSHTHNLTAGKVTAGFRNMGAKIYMAVASSGPSIWTQGGVWSNTFAQSDTSESSNLGYNGIGVSGTTDDSSASSTGAPSGSATGSAHSHSISTTSTSTGGQTEANGAAHNNMPPYLSVYMWKRTA